MSKKLYDITVYNTNANVVHHIVIGGRVIYGKSKTTFNKIGEQKFVAIKTEVLKNRFARMTSVEYTIGEDDNLQKKNLSETEIRIKELLNAGKFDEAKILIDDFNSMKKNMAPTQLFDNPDELNKHILESAKTDDEKEINIENGKEINNNNENKEETVDSNEATIDGIENTEIVDEKENKNVLKSWDSIDFDSMTKKKLLEFAKEYGVKVKNNIPKKELLAILKEKR